MNWFISCVKSKRKYKCRTEDMYISSLFEKSLNCALKFAPRQNIFILSAKYGILELDDIIEPYNQTLCGADKQTLKNWGGQIIKQAKEKNIDLNGVYLCGENYVSPLKDNGIKCITPLGGLSIGKRLSKLNAVARSRNYDILS